MDSIPWISPAPEIQAIWPWSSNYWAHMHIAHVGAWNDWSRNYWEHVLIAPCAPVLLLFDDQSPSLIQSFAFFLDVHFTNQQVFEYISEYLSPNIDVV